MQKVIVGCRPGEKIHEEMITSSDSEYTVDLGDYYAILSSDGYVKEKYLSRAKNFINVPNGFAYNSGANDIFLSVEEIRSLIINHVDSTFLPY